MVHTIIAMICTALMVPTALAGQSIELGTTTFAVEEIIPTPHNPHGACFTSDGRFAYVACSGDDVVIEIDLSTNQIVREIKAPGTPLDVFLSPDETTLIVTQFGQDTLQYIDRAQGTLAHSVTVGESPSLFSRPGKEHNRYVVSERADRVTEIAPDGSQLRSWDTGERPYPADLTSDGILLFIPNRDADSVTIIDTLNNTLVATTPVGDAPQGGVVARSDINYIVANGGGNSLSYINTASFDVVQTVTAQVGPRPFSVINTSSDRYALVNNAGGDSISVLDVPAGQIVGNLTVGNTPIVMRAHPDGQRYLVMCEGAHHIAFVRKTEAPKIRGDKKTEVVVLGMIHSGHRTSERYSLEVVSNLIQTIAPDDVCVEIPPNRLDVAMQQWRETHAISESRVRVFPEYVDVLFPLTDKLDFTIVPCAGWTNEMNVYRRNQLNAIEKDESRASQWAAYEASMETLENELDAIGDTTDPRIIHTSAYDAAIERGYGGPYNEFFNDDLKDGGWDNINAKHYKNIEHHLDSIRGEGRRVLITFGAAHKSWFLRKLRERSDIELLEVAPFLDQIETQVNDK